MALVVRILYALMVASALLLEGCRGDVLVVPAEQNRVGEVDEDSPVAVFYLLNEGNMGSNKCTLDFYDYSTGVYWRNIYADRNPGVVKELGDVGNDLKVYDSRLYAVINCSHKVEVMDVSTGMRIGQIDIPNCRYIAFHGDNAYVSSYVGPVQIDPQAPKGMVYEIDTRRLAITRRVTVGYQPEEIAIVDGYLYVANSGGYREPDYDKTISVVDLESFKQVRQIPVGINPHRLRVDAKGRLWVNSRGNHADIPSSLMMLERDEARGEFSVSKTFQVGCSNFSIYGDRLYFFATDWDESEQNNHVNYGVIDLETLELQTDNFITDGTEHRIAMPYGLTVNRANGDIFVTDARNYVSSGTLYCFSADGKCKWSVRTGDIPSAIAFVDKTDLKE